MPYYQLQHTDKIPCAFLFLLRKPHHVTHRIHPAKGEHLDFAAPLAPTQNIRYNPSPFPPLAQPR
jgi:hypothetical protein